MDPVVAVTALAGVVSTLAGIVYKLLVARAERAEEAELYWRDKAMGQTGLTDVAVDAAKRRRP